MNAEQRGDEGAGGAALLAARKSVAAGLLDLGVSASIDASRSGASDHYADCRVARPTGAR